MYEDFYGLKERPFTLLPDPDFLYLSPQHKLARAYLEYGIKERVGFVVLTGEVGTGKTTLIKSLLRTREGNQRLGVLYQTAVGAEDLLELLLREFEVRGNFRNRSARLAAFNQFLLNAFGRGEHVVLLVDEAQNLGAPALEELRLLSNLQTEKEPLLQVILVGQPGLRRRLQHPALRQLAQRVAVHYHLRPLDLQESKEYVRFRLARAGGSGIFTESALEKLYEYAQGVPRRINAWCDLALVAGFAESRHELDGDFIDTVFQAQGGSLEGPELEETPEGEDQKAASPSMDFGLPASGDGLDAAVMELSGRLTRLEGMMLELTSQVMPVLTQALTRPASAEHLPSVQKEPREPPLLMEETANRHQGEAGGTAAPQARVSFHRGNWVSRLKSWWSRGAGH
jgi:general secretion pathway protein A